MENMQKIEVQAKKEYNAPELLTYGEVRVLTQAGSGQSNEGASIDPLKRP